MSSHVFTVTIQCPSWTRILIFKVISFILLSFVFQHLFLPGFVTTCHKFALFALPSILLSISRCIKGEGEIEKLQAKLMEMKKKLDNTTAAMQELGRENQSLQVHIPLRWQM